MTTAWITEVHNTSRHPFEMWCDVPPGPEAHLGVFDGKDVGSDIVPIPPGKSYLGVTRCGIPSGRHFRYLRGPSGTIRMHSGTAEGYDRLVFADVDAGNPLGTIPIGSAGSGALESVSFNLAISEGRVDWLVADSEGVGPDILNALAEAAKTLGPALSAALAHK